jgi:hypothetical protein
MKTKKGNNNSKKDTGKWCEFHNIPWHNTDECYSIKSLVVELKDKESNPDLDPNSENNRRRQIIDADPLLLLQLQQSNQKRILRRGSDSSIHRCG